MPRSLGVIAVVVALGTLAAATALLQGGWISVAGAKNAGVSRAIFSIGLVIAAALWTAYVVGDAP